MHVYITQNKNILRNEVKLKLYIRNMTFLSKETVKITTLAILYNLYDIAIFVSTFSASLIFCSSQRKNYKRKPVTRQQNISNTCRNKSNAKTFLTKHLLKSNLWLQTLNDFSVDSTIFYHNSRSNLILLANKSFTQSCIPPH